MKFDFGRSNLSKTLVVSFLLISILLNTGLMAQTTVELKVKQSIGSKSKLFRYSGKELITVDSSRADSVGVYRFNIPDSASQGLYRISVGKTGSIDFIVANEPLVKFETVVYAIEDSLKVLESEENKIFVEYSKLKHSKEQQQWLLGSLLSYYPVGSPFAQQLGDEKQQAEFEFHQKAVAFTALDSTLFVSNYINLDTKPFIIDATDECSYKNQLTGVWWKKVDLTDERLLNTPILIKNVWDYLENSICESSYDKEQQDSVFVARIASLLNTAMGENARNQIVGSLCRGFSDSDYYGTLNYLLRNGGNSAQELARNVELRAKLTLEETIAVGAKAFDFKVKPLAGKPFRLSSERSPYKLVIFWSVTCPHCTEMLPQLIAIYSDYADRGFGIIAVSIDEETGLWKKYIDEKHTPWYNMQLNGDNYSNSIITRYNVDETPKMFLIDRNLKIISRPSSAEQLRLKLKKLL